MADPPDHAEEPQTTLEGALVDLMERLRAAQKDLPPEAADILQRNLWRLYE